MPSPRAYGLLFIAACVLAEPLSAQTECGSTRISYTSDYQSAVASSAAAGSYRWLLDGKTVAEGKVAQLALIHFDNDSATASGGKPVETRGVSFQPGKWSTALAVASGGVAKYPLTGNLSLQDGTIEMWIAPRSDATASIYTQYEHRLLNYIAPNADQLLIGVSHMNGNFYAGINVAQKFVQAGGPGITGWKAGEWHHLAFTYSIAKTRLRLYLDGKLLGEYNGTVTAPAATGDGFTVGGDPWNASAFLVDELRTSSDEKAADEIRADAARTGPFLNNEARLSLSGLAPGRLEYQLTPSGTNTPCAAVSSVYTGLPITDFTPASGLLPTGTDHVAVSFRTLQPASCAYSVGTLPDYGAMQPFEFGQRSAEHAGTIRGLSPDSAVVNRVYVRCDASPDYVHPLKYRSVTAPPATFPRIANIWSGGSIFRQYPQQAARTGVFMAPGLSADEARSLRQINPGAVILVIGSTMNTVDDAVFATLPDSYFVNDVSGKRIEGWPPNPPWPPTYYLNLTNPAVPEFIARYAYDKLVKSDLAFDGMFFDNFFPTVSWITTDYRGDPVRVDADNDGKPDDPAVLDAAWRKGLYAIFEAFRKLAPDAYAVIHADGDRPNGDMLRLFNGDAILNDCPIDVAQGTAPFTRTWERYHDWFRSGRQPVIMGVQTMPPYLVAYGYGYDPLHAAPAATVEFARTWFPNMRFGLTFTLMNDGYAIHDYGDNNSQPGWWYDEYDFQLGQPLGPARLFAEQPEVNLVRNGDFEEPLDGTWGAGGSVLQDEGGVRLSVAEEGAAEVWQSGLSASDGAMYELRFRAKADTPRSITVSFPSDGNVQAVLLKTEWTEHTVSFTPGRPVEDARLRFLIGQPAGAVWLGNVRLTRRPEDVWRRDFTQGIVVMNATAQKVRLQLEPGLARFSGTQAPRYQFLVDDEDTGFPAASGWEQGVYNHPVVQFAGDRRAPPPYYHNWGAATHRLNAGQSGSGEWKLNVPEDGEYTIEAWWPAAPEIDTWSKQAVYEVVADDKVVATATVDQSTAGDQFHKIFKVPLTAAGRTVVRIRNEGAGPVIADALHVYSATWMNDGSPAGEVLLGPFDGILLRRM